MVEIDTQIEIALVVDSLQRNEIAELETYAERVFMMLSKLMDKLDGNSVIASDR